MIKRAQSSKSQPFSYLERRLVVTVQDKIKTFDPKTMRNTINQKLYTKGFSDPIVTIINKSHSKKKYYYHNIEI